MTSLDELGRYTVSVIIPTFNRARLIGRAVSSVFDQCQEGDEVRSGRGRWMDNVFIERLWRSVKYEEVYLKGYERIPEARKELTAYFDFYNKRRRHQGLDDRTPDEAYWSTLRQQEQAA